MYTASWCVPSWTVRHRRGARWTCLGDWTGQVHEGSDKIKGMGYVKRNTCIRHHDAFHLEAFVMDVGHGGHASAIGLAKCMKDHTRLKGWEMLKGTHVYGIMMRSILKRWSWTWGAAGMTRGSYKINGIGDIKRNTCIWHHDAFHPVAFVIDVGRGVHVSAILQN